MVFNSFLVIFLWNQVLSQRIGNAIQISFLEGAGITAFAYVIAFSVRYSAKSVKSHRSLSPEKPETYSAANKPTSQDRCAQMTGAQKEALKRELIAQCGCKGPEIE